MDGTSVKLKIGSLVKLVPHYPISSYRVHVIPLFYKLTVITSIEEDPGFQPYRGSSYKVDIDNGEFNWRADEVKPCGRLYKLKRILE